MGLEGQTSIKVSGFLVLIKVWALNLDEGLGSKPLFMFKFETLLRFRALTIIRA